MATVTVRLTGALRDSTGARICPLGCGPQQAATGDTTCKMATAKSGKPGERVFTPPLPGRCRMFYNDKGEPT